MGRDNWMHLGLFIAQSITAFVHIYCLNYIWYMYLFLL